MTTVQEIHSRDHLFARRTVEELLAPGVKLPESSVLLDQAVADAARAARTTAVSRGVTEELQRMNQSLKISIAQISPLPSAVAYNVAKIKEQIDRAEGVGSEFLVLPELSIPGYMALDYFTQPEFIRANVEALKEIVQYSEGKKVAIIVSFARPGEGEGPINGKPYNSAAIVQHGEVLGLSDKSLLPEYDIFWENRYFREAESRRPIVVNGRKVGLLTCEDLWDQDYKVKVVDELAAQGAELFIDVNASPFSLGKQQTRQKLVQRAAVKHQAPFIYANMVGAQDGYEGEIVFDGRSMVFNAQGECVALGRGFAEDFISVDIHQTKPIPLPDWIQVEEMHDALVLGIRDYFRRNGFRKAYIGLSGGIDSALTAALCVAALGAENVIGVTMPSHITSSETKDDAIRLAALLGIRCHTRPIGEIYRAWLGDAERAHGELEGITKQNLQARLRGMILMEYTNQDREALIVSTGNKTEMALGYCTLYGDMCGGLGALADVSKEWVYELSRYVNQRAGREAIPYTTIERVPTAELEAGQTDRDNLPADYPVLSPLVDRIIEDGTPRELLITELKAQGVADAVTIVDRTMALIEINEYKRRQAPPGIKVTQKSFGGGRRYPVTSRGFGREVRNASRSE